jgi:hypothetical protein
MSLHLYIGRVHIWIDVRLIVFILGFVLGALIL